MDCVFCKIVAGEIPNHTVWEDENHLGFLNIFPNTEGYTVLVSKEHHTSDFATADEIAMSSLVSTARKVSDKLVAAYEDVARCGLVFEGTGVDHLHCHVIPMHGSTDESWKDRITKTEFIEKYSGYLSTQESNKEFNHEDLAAVAAKINGK